MKLDKIVSVSSMPGLQKLIATRNNGLLVENFENGKRQFVSARKHQFTPLVSIGIYTYMDTTPIEDVFKKIDSSQEADPAPDPNEKAEKLREWFKKIVPDHDEDRVHINDIRKIIKWFHFLKKHDPGQFAGDEEE